MIQLRCFCGDEMLEPEVFIFQMSILRLVKGLLVQYAIESHEK